MKNLSESMMVGAEPEDIPKMQLELKKAFTKTQALDETLLAVMDTTSYSVRISFLQGVIKRTLQPFPAALLTFDRSR